MIKSSFKSIFKRYIFVFFTAFIFTIIAVIPELIRNKGMFLFAGDFTEQQIPFLKHGIDYLKEGKPGWDWNTDLGSDFIGSYSFYFLGSPFFWLIRFFDSSVVEYLLSLMIALKTAVAALTSYIYISRYVKDERCCYLGAFMYAYSGFQFFNIIYFHFHDVTALFPLLLLSFDMLVTENKRAFFAVMTALSAFTNYYFFIGEVVFIIIYYVIKCLTRDFKFTKKSFISIFVESVIGVMIASVILMPSFYAVSSVERSGNFLYGTNLVSYSDNTIIPKILQSIFILPDLPACSQLFQSELNPNNWASISLYIPFFASVGVVAYIKNNRRSFIAKLLSVCLLMALIPVLNSIFYLFNSTYYARWFYMPVLFMCIATAKCLENDYDLIPGIKFQAAGLIILALIGTFPNKVDDKSDVINYLNSGDKSSVRWFGMSIAPEIFWQSVGFGAAFLLAIYVYNAKKSENKKSLNYLVIAAVSLTLFNEYRYLNYIKNNIGLENTYEIYSSYSPQLEENEFYRIYNFGLGNGRRNLSLLWNKHSAGQYHSIIPGSAEKMFTSLTGKFRQMETDYTEKDFAAFSLLSVKYIFNESTGDDLNVQIKPVDIPGFELYDKQGCFYIYENKYFVPMGYLYDRFITDEKLHDSIDKLDLTSEQKQNYKQMELMRSVVLSPEDAAKYASVLTETTEADLESLSEEKYFSECEAKRSNTCYNFSYDHQGFSAEFDSESSGLLFFSVPVAKGWTAKVNGENTDIITVQYGLSAVEISPGHSTIEFVYETPGLETGLVLSLIGIGLLIVYVLCFKFIMKVDYK